MGSWADTWVSLHPEWVMVAEISRDGHLKQADTREKKTPQQSQTKLLISQCDLHNWYWSKQEKGKCLSWLYLMFREHLCSRLCWQYLNSWWAQSMWGKGACVCQQRWGRSQWLNHWMGFLFWLGFFWLGLFGLVGFLCLLFVVVVLCKDFVWLFSFWNCSQQMSLPKGIARL